MDINREHFLDGFESKEKLAKIDDYINSLANDGKDWDFNTCLYNYGNLDTEILMWATVIYLHNCFKSEEISKKMAPGITISPNRRQFVHPMNFCTEGRDPQTILDNFSA